MTRNTSFVFHGRMFISKWSLLIRVTLNTWSVAAGGETRLFQLKPSMRVVTIATLHCAFEHLVMKWPAELGLRLAVATDTELWLARTQHVCGQQIGISSLGFGHERV